MSNSYGVSEIVGASIEGIDDAIKQAVTTASETLRNLEWFEVTSSAATSRTARSPTSR